MEALMPNEFYRFITEVDTKRPIVNILRALATGSHVLCNVNGTWDRGAILACYIASDLVMRSIRPNEQTGMSTKTISFMLEQFSDSHLREFLTNARIVLSASTGARNKAKQFIEAMEKGYQLGPYDLCAVGATPE